MDTASSSFPTRIGHFIALRHEFVPELTMSEFLLQADLPSRPASSGKDLSATSPPASPRRSSFSLLRRNSSSSSMERRHSIGEGSGSSDNSKDSSPGKVRRSSTSRSDADPELVLLEMGKLITSDWQKKAPGAYQVVVGKKKIFSAANMTRPGSLVYVRGSRCASEQPRTPLVLGRHLITCISRR